MIKESWKDIAGFEGLYQVSNLGRVKSTKHYSWNGYKKWLKPEKILKQHSQKNKYLFVSLCKNAKSKKYRVHRLVAEAFIPNPNNFPQVNHKDENPTNNRADNLEWCNAKYNINYGNHNSKLSIIKKTNKYKQIAIRNGRKASKVIYKLDLSGKVLEKFPSMSDAAKKYNIKVAGISNCCRGKSKRYKGYMWKFAKGLSEGGKYMALQIEEQWRPIKGYEDKYWVSNLGRVKNKTSIMKLKLTNSGVITVALYGNGKSHHRLVARLVAEAFLLNPNGYTRVMHKDDDPTNNRIDNLYWDKQFYHEETHGLFKLDTTFYITLHRLEKRYGSVVKAPNNDSDLIKIRKLVGDAK